MALLERPFETIRDLQFHVTMVKSVQEAADYLKQTS